MRKVSYARFGGPEVLQVLEAEAPRAGAGQVRIAVHAAGVNPVDWRIREGQMLRPELPAGTGQDAAGVVDQLGEGVTGVAVGDRVFGEGESTYAESAVLSVWARMPDDLSFEEAAGYPSVVETALRILDQVGVQPGQTLLVSGASGGVGSAVLQIARDRGIHVIGTGGVASQGHLRDLGATPVQYGDGWADRVRALGDVDAALDLAGAGVLDELVRLTGDPQRVVSIADLTAPEHGVRFSGQAGSMPEALRQTVDLVERGALRIPVEQSYPLEAAAQAQADSQAGHTRGRRVIRVR